MAGPPIHRRIAARLLQINDTPESIALGAAVGMFIAMTPTVGVQMIIVLVVGTFIRANRLAGIAMVYISNPLTLLPIYWVDYLTGCLVLGKDHITKEKFFETCDLFMAEYKAEGLWVAGTSFVQSYGDIAIAMFVGGALIGLVCAIPTYPITLRALRAHHRRRDRRKALHAERKRRREVREERRRERAGRRGKKDPGEGAPAPVKTAGEP